MRVTFSLALSSLEFDPQTQLSSAPDLIKLFCTDSQQADNYSVSPVTSTLLNLVLRPQPLSYWTIHSIWQTLSLLWKLWHHLASRRCRLLGFLLPPWSFGLCLFGLFFLMHLASYHCALELNPWTFFLYFPSAGSYSLFKKNTVL